MWISVNNLKEILRDFKSKVIDKSTFDTTKTDLEEKINNIDTSTFMSKAIYDTDDDGIVDEAKTASMIKGLESASLFSVYGKSHQEKKDIMNFLSDI